MKRFAHGSTLMSKALKGTPLGFTLIELLVVIAILALLSLIGFALLTGLTKGARDDRRKSDINEIAKAYELHYDGTYHELTATDFGGGEVPKRPEGGDYDGILSGDASGFRVCAPLGDVAPSDHCSSPSSTCYCKKSSLGTFTTPASTPASTPVSTPASTPVSTSTPTPTPTCHPNLAGYWNFDEGTGANVIDSSSSGNDGAWTGIPSWVPGEFGYAGQFDGTSAWIDTTNVYDFSSNQVTMAAWIKINGNGNTDNGENTIISIPDWWDYYKFFWNKNNGRIGCQIDYVGDAALVLTGNTTLTSGDPWYHVACTYDGSTARVYVNGAPDGSTGGGGVMRPARFPANIGAMRGGGRLLNGLIDDVRIYNRALSPSEVTSLYNGGVGCNLP